MTTPAPASSAADLPADLDLRLLVAAAEHGPDAAFWIDDRGRVFRANAQAARSLGVAPEALVGREVWTFDPSLTPEAWQRIVDEVRQGVTARFRTRHRRADGSEFPVEITTTRQDVQGRTFGFAVARDLSDWEARERHLDNAVARLDRRNTLILTGTTDGFIAADIEGRVVDTNPAMCRLLGYTRDEMLALTLDDIEGVDDAAEIARRREAFRRDGHARFETLHRRKDGSLVPVEVAITRVSPDEGALLFGFARDITERSAAHRALLAAKDEAERANRAKSEFLSRMSHELRTPLNAILGFGQLLEMPQGETHRRAHAHEMVAAGRHLLTLIDEVLDLARVEAGKVTVSLEPVALQPLVHECLALLQPQAQAAEVHLRMPGAGCRVDLLADRTRLKQVLLNLLSNAIKYNRAGGSVSVECAPTPSGGHRVQVIDTGDGLSPEQTARLFVPFERLEAERRHLQGTGIGLALSHRLMAMMGGELGVDSRPGAGSTFWFDLPLAAGSPAAVPAAGPAQAPATGPAAGTVDLLCIEDNPANLRLVESIFAHRPGVRLLSAIAPGLGLELARQHRPALILLDIHLPDMDGFAVLECLRQHVATRDIPVIAVSAHAMPRDVERARAAGFADYLTKPLDVALLERTVNTWLARLA